MKKDIDNFINIFMERHKNTILSPERFDRIKEIIHSELEIIQNELNTALPEKEFGCIAFERFIMAWNTILKKNEADGDLEESAKKCLQYIAERWLIFFEYYKKDVSEHFLTIRMKETKISEEIFQTSLEQILEIIAKIKREVFTYLSVTPGELYKDSCPNFPTKSHPYESQTKIKLSEDTTPKNPKTQKSEDGVEDIFDDIYVEPYIEAYFKIKNPQK